MNGCIVYIDIQGNATGQASLLLRNSFSTVSQLFRQLCGEGFAKGTAKCFGKRVAETLRMPVRMGPRIIYSFTYFLYLYLGTHSHIFICSISNEAIILDSLARCSCFVVV